jgi:hypothetical protein
MFSAAEHRANAADFARPSPATSSPRWNAISGPGSIGSRSITGTPTIPMSTCWCEASRRMAPISSSPVITSATACGRGPRTWSPPNSAQART